MSKHLVGKFQGATHLSVKHGVNFFSVLELKILGAACTRNKTVRREGGKHSTYLALFYIMIYTTTIYTFFNFPDTRVLIQPWKSIRMSASCTLVRE